MEFRRLYKKTNKKCDVCQEINEETNSEIIIIETPMFTKIFCICNNCQEIEDLVSELTISDVNNAKLRIG